MGLGGPSCHLSARELLQGAGEGGPQVLGCHSGRLRTYDCLLRERCVCGEGGGQGTEEFEIVKQPVQTCVVERALAVSWVDREGAWEEG